MSVFRMWTICDRCSFKFRRSQMQKEANGLVVCQRCYDGKFDSVRHPQNRPFRPRRELLPVPDGRPQDEPGEPLVELVDGTDYAIAQSIYIRVP